MYHRWQSHGVWFQRYGTQQSVCFLSFWTIFYRFNPSKNPKSQNFEKMKKMTGDIIILHMCTIDDNHMMYNSWYIACNGQNFLSFWTIFCHFNPPKNLKNQNFEKMKKTPSRIIILHMYTIKDNHMMYGSWDTECDRENFLSCWTIFCHFTP